MSTHPPNSRFEFVIMASARARQLLEGCRPKIDGQHKTARIAQHEVTVGALWSEPADERNED
jgi:DNA-directed RNA polymerase subunit K/omega